MQIASHFSRAACEVGSARVRDEEVSVASMKKRSRLGYPTGQWRQAGADPTKERCAHGALVLEGGLAKGASADPYNQTSPAPLRSANADRRRSLDDMRRLSETIKSSAYWVPPPRKPRKPQ